MIFYRVHGFKRRFMIKRYITNQVTIDVASHKSRYFPIVSIESKRTITLYKFNGTMRFKGEDAVAIGKYACCLNNWMTTQLKYAFIRVEERGKTLTTIYQFRMKQQNNNNVVVMRFDLPGGARIYDECVVIAT